MHTAKDNQDERDQRVDSWLTSSFDVNFNCLFRQDFGSNDDDNDTNDKEYSTLDKDDEYKGDSSENSEQDELVWILIPLSSKRYF
jgi:hypothetical protein